MGTAEQKEWAAPVTLLVITALMLFAAIGSWDYSYYKAVRWVTCFTFAWSSYIAWHSGFRYRVAVFFAIAVLFNPIVPIHLDKAIWQVVDAAVAVIVIVMAWLSRSKQPTREEREYRHDMTGIAIAITSMGAGIFAGTAISKAFNMGWIGETVLALVLTISLLYLSLYLWHRFRPR